MSEIRRKAIKGLRMGDTFNVLRTFTEQDMVYFGNITRDYNPVHFDERFAEVKKLRGRICHGLLVASMVTEIGGQIGWFASGMNFCFKRPVYFGDTIKCSLIITDIDEKGRAKANAVYQNQDGITVLEAFVTGIVPGFPEQQVLNAMVAEGDPTDKLR